jgi:hypothetical protein
MIATNDGRGRDLSQQKRDYNLWSIRSYKMEMQNNHQYEHSLHHADCQPLSLYIAKNTAIFWIN